MKYLIAKPIADNLLELLKPHCDRIAIAGSIRREKAEVGDIEIVLIPKPFQTGLFASGIAKVLGDFKITKGGQFKKYVQIETGLNIKADIFFAEQGNWGYIFAIRTGSAEFSKKMASNWVKKGYKGIEGWLTSNGKQVAIPEEISLFQRLGMEYKHPRFRK